MGDTDTIALRISHSRSASLRALEEADHMHTAKWLVTPVVAIIIIGVSGCSSSSVDGDAASNSTDKAIAITSATALHAIA